MFYGCGTWGYFAYTFLSDSVYHSHSCTFALLHAFPLSWGLRIKEELQGQANKNYYWVKIPSILLTSMFRAPTNWSCRQSQTKGEILWNSRRVSYDYTAASVLTASTHQNKWSCSNYCIHTVPHACVSYQYAGFLSSCSQWRWYCRGTVNNAFCCSFIDLTILFDTTVTPYITLTSWLIFLHTARLQNDIKGVDFGGH